MKKREPSAFTRATITAIKAEAKKYHDATEVKHIQPRAYCIAKPAPLCAVFVTPPCDSEPQLRKPRLDESTLIQNGSASGVELGDWCSIAYVCTAGGNGERRVIFNLNKTK